MLLSLTYSIWFLVINLMNHIFILFFLLVSDSVPRFSNISNVNVIYRYKNIYKTKNGDTIAIQHFDQRIGLPESDLCVVNVSDTPPTICQSAACRGRKGAIAASSFPHLFSEHYNNFN